MRPPAVLEEAEPLPRSDRVTENVGGLRRAASMPAVRRRRGPQLEVLQWLEDTAQASEEVIQRLHTEAMREGERASLLGELEGFRAKKITLRWHPYNQI